MQKIQLITGSICMAIAVVLGAFGAHYIQDSVTPERFQVYQTAVDYHIYHSLGLIITGIIATHLSESRWLLWSGRMFLTGILLFSGSLYLMVLTDTGWLGAITPLGGVAFITGWILLTTGIIKNVDLATSEKD